MFPEDTLHADFYTSGHIGTVVASHAEGYGVDSRLRMHRLYYARGAQGVLPMRVCEKVKSSMARSFPVENLLPQNVGSIINCLQ